MADLSAYEDLNDIEFSQEVKQLMELFAESWEECRSDECGACKYRHGKEMYQLLFCLSERYAEKLISNGFAQVRHGRWIKRGYSCGENEYECSVCHETEWRTSASRMNYCMFCGAKMDLKGESEDG